MTFARCQRSWLFGHTRCEARKTLFIILLSSVVSPDRHSQLFTLLQHYKRCPALLLFFFYIGLGEADFFFRQY